MTETDNKTRYGRIAVILIALAIVIAAFVSFIAMNNERIYEQNTKYLQGSTEQSARRISEWMTDSQTEIKLLSSMYESTLASVDEISAAGIEQLANYTKFDYTTISLSDGLTVDDKGQEADASDREYFARGMEGESGVCAVENSLFYNDLSVIFYTPLYFKDEVVGVICGAYREDSMEKFLRTYIFNEQTNTYLLDRNGDVMAHSSITYTSGVKNAVDLYLRGRILGQYLAHRAGGVSGKRRVRHLQLQGGFGRGHGVRHAHRELRLAHHAHLPQLYHRRHAEQGECGRSHVGGPRWWRVGPGGGLPARADHAPAP